MRGPPLVLLLALGCREPAPLPLPPPPPAATEAPAAVMGAILAANVRWGDAIVRTDSPTLADLYAPDAVLMMLDGDVKGGAAVVARLLAARRSIPDSLHATATTTDRLDVTDDRAYEAGTLTYTLFRGGTPREVTVRYFNFWQLSAGRWQLTGSFRPLP